MTELDPYWTIPAPVKTAESHHTIAAGHGISASGDDCQCLEHGMIVLFLVVVGIMGISAVIRADKKRRFGEPERTYTWDNKTFGIRGEALPCSPQSAHTPMASSTPAVDGSAVLAEMLADQERLASATADNQLCQRGERGAVAR